MVYGTCWQACSDGTVRMAPDTALAPFWAATLFAPDITTTLSSVSSWDDLTHQLDQVRPSENLFSAISADGVFETIHHLVACKSAHGTDLVAATSHQAEFSRSSISGCLVGFWTPTYARTINVPSYHQHFLSDDHQHAGHVLDLKASDLSVKLHIDTTSISPYLKPRTFFRRISAAIQPKSSQLPKAHTADLQPQRVWYKKDWKRSARTLPILMTCCDIFRIIIALCIPPLVVSTQVGLT